MELYIIRHAIAVDREDPEVGSDAERWLTKKGIDRMKEAAVGFARLVPELDLIITSPYTRAKQTAEIVADTYKDTKIVESDVLEPPVDFPRFVRLLEKNSDRERIALVGHEPDLSEIVSLLAFGSPEGRIEMGKGAIARVDIEGQPGRSTGSLVWLLQSKILRALAES